MKDDPYAGVELGEGDVIIPLALDEYSRALASLCRCEIVCECTDEQIMAAHARLVEQDTHASRTRQIRRERKRR
jgi:hypothetical protein